MPTAAVCGADGTRLLSWRVTILPLLGHEELYREFKLDEPWDSPHNLPLLDRMPPDYALPPRKQAKLPPYHTVCKVFVGKGAAFEGQRGMRMPIDFPDGTSNTILLAEVGEPVPWTKPEELTYDPTGPLPDLRHPFKAGFRVCMGDCQSRFISPDTSETTLRALITRNAKDDLGSDW